MGWIGTKQELHQVLQQNNVDQDEEGNYKVDGEIVSFMGVGDEFVVGDSAVAYVKGEPRNLCTMLQNARLGLSGILVL